MSQNKIPHLGFIQAIITRMATNSFLIKGWSITLVAAIFALAAKDSNLKFLYIAFFSVVMFWILDAYFLHQERLYRKLYESVADDLTSSDKFTLNATMFKSQVSSMICLLLSKTLLPFYGPLVILIIVTHCYAG